MTHSHLAAALVAAPFMTLAVIWLVAQAARVALHRRAARIRVERYRHRRPF